MVCKNCGAELEEGVKVCAQCGAEADTLEPGSDVPETGQEKTDQPESFTESENLSGEELRQEASQNEEPEQREPLTGQQEDIWKESQTSGGYMDFSNPPPIPEPPKKSKAPMIVIGVIVAAIVAALVYLFSSFGSSKSANDRIREAFDNTMKALNQESEASKALAALLESGRYSQDYSFTLSKLDVDYYGSSQSLLEEIGDVRLSFGGIVDTDSQKMRGSLGVGVGDMKDIVADFYMDQDVYLFGFPDLYDKYFSMSMEDVEYYSGVPINVEGAFDQKAALEALTSIGNTFSEAVDKAFDDIACRKTKKVVITEGPADIQTQEYALTMSREDSDAFFQGIPGLIENDPLFLDWLVSISSQDEVDELMDLLRDELENFTFGKDVKEVLFGYVYINDKNEIVQIKLPMDDEETEQEGNMTISFLGKENPGDFMQITLDVSSYDSAVSLNYTGESKGDQFFMDFGMDVEDYGSAVANFGMSAVFSYEYNADSYTVTYDSLDIELNDGYTDIALSLSGSYSISKSDGITAPQAEVLDIETLDDDTAKEAVLAIINNALEGGYVPSAYKDYIKDYADYYLGGYSGGNGLDGSEYMEFEEFAALVKDTYGDVFSEEELRQLYDSMYGGSEPQGDGWDMESSVITDYYGNYKVEIVGPSGSVLDEDWSTNSYVYYEDKDRDIDYTFYLTDYTMEEYLEDAFSYQESFVKDSESYQNVKSSEMLRKTINGYEVSYKTFTAEYKNYDGGFTDLVAYVKIDDNCGFVVEVECGNLMDDSVLDECFNSVLPIQ